MRWRKFDGGFFFLAFLLRDRGFCIEFNRDFHLDEQHNGGAMRGLDVSLARIFCGLYFCQGAAAAGMMLCVSSICNGGINYFALRKITI